MTINEYYARLDEICRTGEQATTQNQTTPWWVEVLIAGALAVVFGLFCAC